MQTSMRLCGKHVLQHNALLQNAMPLSLPLSLPLPMSQLLRRWWSSNFKRANLVALPQRDNHKLDAFKAEHFKQRTQLPPSEWQTVRSSLMHDYKHINESNIDAVVLGMCNDAASLPLAKDYITHLRSLGCEPKMASLGRLLRVYNAAYHAADGKLSEVEQSEVLCICEQLRAGHELLDSTTCENLIYGLVTTSAWTQAHDYLKMIAMSCTPTVHAFSEIAIKYFSMGSMHHAAAWDILEQMVTVGKQPKCEIFIAYFKCIVDAMPKIEFLQAFEKMLKFVEKHEIIISELVVNYIIDYVAAKRSDMLVVQRTELSRLGKCRACAINMQHIAITEDEFTRLSDSFLNKVLVRNDVFLKSTPEELQRFKQFVEKTAPYDCVIDGLNVAYSMGSNKPPIAMAKLLAAVVKYFKDRKKDVLVLGRRHMNSWPKEQMQYISKNAKIFLTSNLSQDDPFLLYATLKSGPAADFFSRDLMRSHAFLLDAELKAIFRRWQQEHQYSLVTQTQNGKILVKEPIRHRIYAHRVSKNWHLPYKATYSVNTSNTFTVTDSWLCIKII